MEMNQPLSSAGLKQVLVEVFSLSGGPSGLPMKPSSTLGDSTNNSEGSPSTQSGRTQNVHANDDAPRRQRLINNATLEPHLPKVPSPSKTGGPLGTQPRPQDLRVDSTSNAPPRRATDGTSGTGP